MLRFLVVAILLAALPVRAADVARAKYVGKPPCGVAFDYPTNWLVNALPSSAGTTCTVSLRPRNVPEGESEELYVVEIGVWADASSEFLKEADRMGFDFYQGAWVVRGRPGIPRDAEVVKDQRWWGLQGEATLRCYAPNGGPYVGECEASRAVLEDNDDRMWSMRGGSGAGDVFSMIRESFRFTASADEMRNAR